MIINNYLLDQRVENALRELCQLLVDELNQMYVIIIK